MPDQAVKLRPSMIATVCAMLCGCASHQIARSTSGQVPLVVRIDDIDRSGWSSDFVPRELGVALVSFVFESRAQEEVTRLVDPELAAPRQVYIIEGDSVVARGTLAGGFGSANLQGQLKWGFMLRFETVGEAQQLVDRLREDPREAMDRHLEDRRGWILPASIGPRDSGSRFPAGGLPNLQPQFYGP
jgi:hypothetical protein